MCDRQRKASEWVVEGEVPPEMEERFKWQNAGRREGVKKRTVKERKRGGRGGTGGNNRQRGEREREIKREGESAEKQAAHSLTYCSPSSRFQMAFAGLA